MKKIIVVLFVALHTLSCHISEAAVPKLLTYQGILKNNSGGLLTGTYSMTFRLYNASTSGTLLWSETQPSVSVSAGKFMVNLGSVTAITQDFNADYWLSVQVASDPEISPRTRLTSSGYGIRADNENNGFTQSQHDALSHENIPAVKEDTINLAKANFKWDAYTLATANSMSDLVVDSFNDTSGINAGSSANYAWSGAPKYNVTVTSAGGGILQSNTTADIESTILYNPGTNPVTHNGFGQVFKLASTKTVDKVSIKWRRVGNPAGVVRVRLYTSSAGLPGTLLAESADIALSSLSVTSTEMSYSFTAISLTAGTDYIICVENIAGSGDNSNFVYYSESSSDLVYGMVVWKNASGAWAKNTDYGSNYDLYFKLYEQQTYSGTATVVSNAYTLPTVPTEAMIVADETLGTGTITYSVSRDGTNYTTCTKETVTSISGQPSGTQLKWKAVITGNAQLNAIAVAV